MNKFCITPFFCFKTIYSNIANYWACPKFCCLQNTLSCSLWGHAMQKATWTPCDGCFYLHCPKTPHVCCICLFPDFDPQSFQNMLLPGAVILVFLLPGVCMGSLVFSKVPLKRLSFISESLIFLLSTYSPLFPSFFWIKHRHALFYNLILYGVFIYLLIYFLYLPIIGFMRSKL